MSTSILHKIDVLRPKPSPCKLIRIGGSNDGAYLLPDDLIGIKACFSPGVANRKDFEDELLDRFGIVSHMCDFSSDLENFKSPLKLGQTFKKKWLDVNGDNDSISLDEWVHELEPDPKNDLILQIDIEGAEYRNLLSTSDTTLSRFRIIVIELHKLSACQDQNIFDQELGPLLDRLNMNFICVHAHPNNCCGEFILTESKLNIPNILELTFLRRDRCADVEMGHWFMPMLPHPLDISRNVYSKAPLFLNEHWLESGARHPNSTIKLLVDKLDYQDFLLLNYKSAEVISEKLLINDLFKLSQFASKNFNSLSRHENNRQLEDLAAGKRFKLSSQFGSYPQEGTVIDCKPFFFHTGEGRFQCITVDLGNIYQLHELHIRNRTDICLDRANFLFYILHNQPDFDFETGLAVSVNQQFLLPDNPICMTDLRGIKSQYVTIFTPQNTMLHFSDLKIFGCF